VCSDGYVPRPLKPSEIEAVLARDVPLHLATIDADGFPHITPLWFEWDGTAFWMTSLPEKPHVRRLRRNDAACVCVDVEGAERPDGQRPNRQVRSLGRAELSIDLDGARTRRITTKYVTGPASSQTADARAAVSRVMIRLEPLEIVAIASV
jgi:nitroimidazol reductase NimA-like FMN-containing flavoprotein (pyridoxamine 5'-phosphate oxidase superfamily)